MHVWDFVQYDADLDELERRGRAKAARESAAAAAMHLSATSFHRRSAASRHDGLGGWPSVAGRGTLRQPDCWPPVLAPAS